MGFIKLIFIEIETHKRIREHEIISEEINLDERI